MNNNIIYSWLAELYYGYNELIKSKNFKDYEIMILKYLNNS